MKKYSLMQPLYLSFFSRDLYQDVRTNWKGTGFLYLLLLLAVTWLPVMYQIHVTTSKSIRQEAPKYIEQVPKIRIIGGKASIDRPVPYTISVPGEDTPLMVIDTSGQITSFEQTPAYLLLTRDKFMYQKQGGTETRIYDLSAIEELTLDRDRVSGWVEAFRKYFAAFAYPIALGFSFIYRIVQMLLYAAIGMIFVSMLKASLDYVTVLRLSSVSVTPAVVLSMVRTLTGIQVPAFWLVCFSIAMGYLFFAIKTNAEPAHPVVR